MRTFAAGSGKSSLVFDRELQEKSLDPAGPCIRCSLCGWSPRKDDLWSCTCGITPSETNRISAGLMAGYLPNNQLDSIPTLISDLSNTYPATAPDASARRPGSLFARFE